MANRHSMDVEAIAPEARVRAPKLAAIFTGGTISMTHSGPGGGVVPTLGGDAICRAVPGLLERFAITPIDFGQFPGPHMSVERAVRLAATVEEAFAAGAEGVVITHGTDTLEETAFLLDLLHRDLRPVVLVGAMRASDELSWDGPVNLFSACRVASSPYARERGVMVVMNNTIHAASEVNKTYTEAIDTFVSPDMGPLGIVDSDQVIFYRGPARRVLLKLNAGCAVPARVELLVATAASDGALVDGAMAAGARGIVVAALGRGNVPPSLAAALQRALGQGLEVVVCSRCWGGRVAPIYSYDGGGAQLAAAGAVFAPWHNGPKARLALSLALGAGYERQALRELFGAPDVSEACKPRA